MTTVLFCILTCVSMTLADYACVCNHNVEQTVFYAPVDTAAAMGYIHEFECTEQIPMTSLDPSWLRVIFEQNIGYVPIKDGIQLQMCQGDPLNGGIVTIAASTTTKNTMTATTKTTILPPTTTSTTTTPKPATITANPATTTTPIPTATTPKLTTTTHKSTTTAQKPTPSSTTWTTSTFKPIITAWQTTHAPFTNSYNHSDGNTRLCQGIHPQHASDNSNILGQYGAFCYEIMPHSKMSWQHGEAMCQSKHGHLVSITSAQEQAFVQGFMQRHMATRAIWIGLHDTKTENVFEWTSGDKAGYTNWISGHLNNFQSHNQEDCVALIPYKGGTWDDIPCGFEGILGTDAGETHPIMCKFDVQTTLQTTIPPSLTTVSMNDLDGNTNLCTNLHKQHALTNGNVLAQYGSHCFELMSRVKVTWLHGESLCLSVQGHLLHIGSAAEQTFIDSFTKRHMPDHAVWIGLHDTSRESHFEWTTGDRVSYTHWIPGHLNNFKLHGDEDCVVLVPYKGGQWDDIPCGDSSILFPDAGETHPIICQYDTISGPSLIG